MIRALGYYLSRTFVNQVKKLFRTWFLIFFLACCLMGGLIGFAAGSLADKRESFSSQSQIEELTDENADREEADTGIFASAFEGLDRNEILEAGMGLLTLVLFFYAVFSAEKNGSSIFLPADTALLFPSPWRPQSVLMFRLICRMAMYFFLAIILIFDLPALNDGLQLTAAGTAALIPAFFLVLFYDQLLTTFCYCWAASVPGRKKKLRTAGYIFCLALVAAFLAWTYAEGGSPLKAAVHFLSSPSGRWIPVWGWLRGMVFCAADGKIALACLFGCLLVLGCVLLLAAIRRLRPDFYEDAMAKSEETAAIQEQAREGRIAFRKGDKKDRSDKLMRDGLKHGRGASIFFWKELYNHSRFARFGIFNKTSETYLVIALAASLIGLRVLPDLAVYVPFLALAVVVFFRSLGNPLEKDLATAYYFLIPEAFWKKLLFSELGGLAVTLLDLLPAMILSAVLTRMQIMFFSGAIVFSLTLSYYCINTGAFLNATLPSDAGTPVKQLVQIMFVYFGLVPDIGIIAAGFSGAIDWLSVSRGILLAGLVNCLVGSIFLVMIPAFLDPVPGRIPYSVNEPSIEKKKQTRKEISLAGFACLFVFVVGSVLQFAAATLYTRLTGVETPGETASWLITFLPLYLAAFPLGICLLRKYPADKNGSSEELLRESPAEKNGTSEGLFRENPAVENNISEGETANKAANNNSNGLLQMTWKRFLAFFVVSVFLMYAGSWVGNLVNFCLKQLTGASSSDTAQMLAGMDSTLWKIVFPVIVGPAFEELFFRKALITRLLPYGERFALLFSAIAFGLFHGNLVQILYAFLIGLVFAYIYIRTGQIRWSVMLHILINFMGIIVAGSPLGDTENMSAASIAYLVFLIFCMLAGMAILIAKAQTCFFVKQERELPLKTAGKLTIKAPGFLAFLIVMAVMIILSFL
ncbi:MAG: putative ABC exporter domain-containing protein [Eubacterium sp.]|nr:putative ABC exporter domain-containing protein [Eubacterium sp.]